MRIGDQDIMLLSLQYRVSYNFGRRRIEGCLVSVEEGQVFLRNGLMPLVPNRIDRLAFSIIYYCLEPKTKATPLNQITTS